jgi:P27 family predicted phage terminase small subunit
MRGRKPKPTAQKILEGNAGRRPINTAEPQPPALDPAFDTPPPEIEAFPIAVAEWRRLAPMLRACKQITHADRAALIAVCLEWARYLDAMAQVKILGLVVKAPSGYPITNPFLPIATKALANCNKLWPELGLTPSSRSRVKMVEGSGPGPEGDAFSEFDAPPVVPEGSPVN